jgi:hypothetical protein
MFAKYTQPRENTAYLMASRSASAHEEKKVGFATGFNPRVPAERFCSQKLIGVRSECAFYGKIRSLTQLSTPLMRRPVLCGFKVMRLVQKSNAF